MPRPKKPGQDGKEVKKRSRNGCWPCKARKVKCGEEKPACQNCSRQGEICDYSIRLNWDGRTKKKEDGTPGSQTMSFGSPPSLPRQYSNSSEQNGSMNESQAISLSPRQRDSRSRRTASPYPTPVMQDQMLPPMTDFTNGGSMCAPDFEPTALPVPPVLRNPSWGDPPQSNTFPAMAHMPSLRQQTSLPAYPSPADSSFGSPGNAQNPFHNGYSMTMPPPLPVANSTVSREDVRSPFNPPKRMRLSPRNESFGRNQHLVRRSSSYGPGDVEDVTRPAFNPLTPTFLPSYLNNPITPANSSNSHVTQEHDDRRISVSSLLSAESPEPPDTDEIRGPTFQVYPPAEEQYVPAPRRGSLHHRMISYSETETYGQDRGYPDLDIPRNNDTMAITGSSPSEHSDFDSWLKDFEPMPEFGFGLESKEMVFAKGGYYANPVAIKIPRKLEPLPQTLSENPMNLLYFHHFLNHTARILVPHDCPENPFKTILPKMAVENQNLLNLMLAYSASHRARLLSHPEPANRIALWVRDVFPSLRQSLDNISSSAELSNANLATAIMLASLEIISPSSFGVSIPWQNHLSIARSIIRQRGGPHSVSRKDPVMYFLTRWLAYLDVLGSLSGRWNEEPLYAGNYWISSHDDNVSAKELSLTDEDTDEDDDYTIDCLLGFTTRCVSILAQIALLARQCDGERIDSSTGQVNTEWRPSDEILKQAEGLRRDLEHAREHEQKQCSHHSPVLSKAELYTQRSNPVDLDETEAEESLATNSAFHWAGLVHLLRRIHNLPRSDPQVQNAVHEIVLILGRIREGGSAEACLLFPMFTAGVEAEDEGDREAVLLRIQGAEGLGMCQVGRARRIMEEVWKTGVSWESLVTGEFFG